MTALFTVLALDALRDRRGDLPTPVLAVLSVLIARMPAGVMVILLCYCLRDLPVTHPGRLVAPLSALAATVAVHLWRRSALVSIGAGTVVYVMLANAVHLH